MSSRDLNDFGRGKEEWGTENGSSEILNSQKGPFTLGRQRLSDREVNISLPGPSCETAASRRKKNLPPLSTETVDLLSLRNLKTFINFSSRGRSSYGTVDWTHPTGSDPPEEGPRRRSRESPDSLPRRRLFRFLSTLVVRRKDRISV